MSSKPETAIVNAIEKWVMSRPNSVILKIFGSGMVSGGQPDLIGGWTEGVRTVHFAIECKIPGKEPTPRQFYRLRQWKAAGYITGVAHSLEEFRRLCDITD